MDSYGLTIEPSPYGRRGVVASPEQSCTGNIILWAGKENGPGEGWSQSVCVVMTPDEAMELCDKITELLGKVR